MKIKRIIEIEAEEKDLKLLDEYGFYYKKNVEKMIKDVAAEMRACIAVRDKKNGRRKEKKA